MLKVLIVEDEEVIRKGLVYTIDWIGMGCDMVGAARDGVEGLEMIRHHAPDLVITDIKMPRMDGIQMLEAARNELEFTSVILTSYSDFDFAKKAISLHVFDYLLKPVDEDILRQIIEKARTKTEFYQCYSQIIEQVKSSPLSKLENWSIYQYTDGSQDPYVQTAISRIIHCYDQKLSIEALAEELQVSDSYLSRKFKETMGRTFLDVLNQYRIQKAIGLLKQPTNRIYEVAFQTGFSDYKHLFSVFKKYTGMSPGEFVKTIDYQAVINQKEQTL